MVLSHMGNWELYAPLCQVLPQYQWSCIYQPLGNRYIEAYVQKRAQPGHPHVQPQERLQWPHRVPARGRRGRRADRSARGRPRHVDAVVRAARVHVHAGRDADPAHRGGSWCRWPWSRPGPARWKLVISSRRCRAWRPTARPWTIERDHRAPQPQVARTSDQPLARRLVLGPQPLENAEAEISPRHLPARVSSCLPDMTPDQLKPFRIVVRVRRTGWATR